MLTTTLLILATPATTCQAVINYDQWPVPKRWHAPKWWLKQAVCIHEKEGAWNANTGNGYYGGMQFLESTWKRAGGRHHSAFDHPGSRSHPFSFSVREQLYRAWVIYRAGGGSWREWGTAGRCGLA